MHKFYAYEAEYPESVHVFDNENMAEEFARQWEKEYPKNPLLNCAEDFDPEEAGELHVHKPTDVCWEFGAVVGSPNQDIFCYHYNREWRFARFNDPHGDEEVVAVFAYDDADDLYRGEFYGDSYSFDDICYFTNELREHGWAQYWFTILDDED